MKAKKKFPEACKSQGDAEQSTKSQGKTEISDTALQIPVQSRLDTEKLRILSELATSLDETDLPRPRARAAAIRWALDPMERVEPEGGAQ